MIKLEEKFNNYYKSLEEDFLNTELRKIHFDKHQMEFEPPFESEEEYEIFANKFALLYTQADSAYNDNAPLVGYIDKKGLHVLYSRWTKELAMFYINPKDKKNPTIITYFTDISSIPGTKFTNLRDGKTRNDDFKFYKEFPHIEAKLKKEREEAEQKQKQLEKEKKKELGRKKHAKKIGKKK